MKLYTFTIPEDAAEGRLLPLARRMLPQLRDSAVRDAFDRRDVKLNGQRVGRDAPLLAGAEVRLYAADDALRAPVPVLYQDENVLVIRKPAGVSCEHDPKGGKTVTELLWEQLRANDPRAAEPLLCHRLDNPTDGLLLLARSQEAQAAMQAAFAKRQIQKQYVCLVRGEPEPPTATLRAWLLKDAERARVRVLPYAAEGALPIVTEYTVLQGGECSRLLVALHTGRTHQIRAQLARIGHPLLGDDLYGDRDFNKRMKAKRLMLCAVSLSFSLEGSWQYLNGMTFTIDPTF